jgi:hypothetical protein
MADRTDETSAIGVDVDDVRPDETTGVAVSTSTSPEEVGESPRPVPWLALALCLIGAFVYRLVLGHYVHDFKGDSTIYAALGHNLAKGHGYSVVTRAPYLASDQRWPAYPIFLAVAYLIHDSAWSVTVLNALLGTIATLLVYMMARALQLREALCIGATAVAALFIATASFAGDIAAENLSVPAVLAFVYVVLLKPPKRRLWLFVLGTVLAWVVALTRQELLIFIVIAAIVAGRHLKLRALAIVGLVACFLVGPAVWVARNDIQVHRFEYTDSIQADEAYVVAVNDREGSPLYVEGEHLTTLRSVPPAVRNRYQHDVFTYDKNFLEHHFPTYVERKITAGIEYPFPDPIYGIAYGGSTSLALGKLAWSVVLAAEYALAILAARRWWKRGQRWTVVAIWLFPVFDLLLIVVDNPVPRYWLPSVLVLLPAAFAGLEAVPGAWRAFNRKVLGGGPRQASPNRPAART